MTATVRSGAAAKLLCVSASTMRAWDRRYGYPVSVRSAGGHRLYEMGDIIALRDALAINGSIRIAIELCRSRRQLFVNCPHCGEHLTYVHVAVAGLHNRHLAQA